MAPLGGRSPAPAGATSSGYAPPTAARQASTSMGEQELFSRVFGDNGPSPTDAGIPTARSGHGDIEMDMIMNEDDDVVLSLVALLAGDVGRGYSRERRSTCRRMVSEVFSPPRVTRHLSKYPSKHLVPGFAMDLTCIDEDDDQPWDFDRADKRQKALERVRREKPLFLIGSPVCTPWCTWQRLNELKRDPQVVHREKVKSLVHLNFVESLYREQMDNGRYFIHEHPECALSWRTDAMSGLLSDERVHRLRADQCQF